MKRVHYVQDGKAIPLEAFFERSYAPKLLAQVLSGSLQPAAGAGLELARPLRLPPKVAFASPRDGKSFESEAIEVAVRAADQGGGVDEIRLYQNGKLVSEESRDIQVAAKEGAPARTFRVVLAPGVNQLKAVALSRDRIESGPAFLRLELKAPEAGADLHLVAVGINEYKNPKYRLNYGRPDAEGFARIVSERAAGLFKRVHTTLVLDAEATRTAVEAAVERVKAAARPQDVFVFYYAGHGVMSEGTQARPADFHLVLQDVVQLYGDDDSLDAKALPAQRLREISRSIQAQKQVLVFDACQSGGAVEAFAMRGAQEERALAQLARSAGVAVLASTSSEQLAAEFKTLGHGVFTYSLLQGLSGRADGNKDRAVTVQELSAWLNESLPDLTREHRGQAQYPNSFVKGMDFPLGMTP